MSRSGFYSWINRPWKADTLDEKLLVSFFNEKKGKFGIRRLKMGLERRYKLRVNLKKIRRIKNKFKLITSIRKKSNNRAGFKKGEEHSVAPNLVQRHFSPMKGEIVLSTDITELRYLNGKKAYLSAVKNLRSKEIVNFFVSQSPTLDLALNGLSDLFESIPRNKRKEVIMHSDQGFHYTSYAFRAKLAEFGIMQSMSRKGNCLDNSPIESFFGHLKDEVEYKTCKNFNEVNKKIKSYIYYYNNERPQWGLKQKTPAEAGVKS